MSHAEFVDLVSRMRDAQRRYFRTRDRADLDESKRLEREVDSECKAAKAASDPQERFW